ncbi:MAG: hypothetical protein LBU51_11230 [Bacteroidales bacterium]|jgi:hypothetical protein|nr:hypothetical protein [Bacteroidales bacterium]
MKKKMSYWGIAIIVLAVGVVELYRLYYYYPRTVSFELTNEILKFENCYPRNGFDYVENAEQLMYWLVTFYQRDICVERGLTGYDSIFVQNISKELDFKKCDYLITYQKQLKELQHSPYLTKTEDDLYFDKRTPLIPTWDSVITDKVYIYRIKKNNKYRSFGP